MVNVTEPLTMLPAIAVGGTETVVVTSASGDTAVVAVALSVSVLGPWPVVVPIIDVATTAPEAGAVKAMPTVIVAPEPRLAGIPVNVTAPDAAL